MAYSKAKLKSRIDTASHCLSPFLDREIDIMLQAGRSRVRVPVRSFNFFSLTNLCNRSRPWGLLSL
jgi:hypothetical protein